MKFQLAINLERTDDRADMRSVARHTLEMEQMADEGGFPWPGPPSITRGR